MQIKNKIISNAGWIILCRIIQSIISLVISFFTARYLGPSNFGLISYAQALTTFALPLVQLGLNSILVKELINYPEHEGRIIGSSLTMSVISAILSIGGIFVFCSISTPDELTTKLVCLLYSTMLIFQSFELLQYWFQSKYLSKYTSLVMLFSYVIVASYKTYLLVSGKSVYWFAISNSFDCLLISCGLAYYYRKLGGERMSFSIGECRRLLAVSKYYILSALMVTVFAQIDRVMIKLMLGDSSAGYYSAAATCVTVTSFIFAAIIDSMRPLVLENKAKDNNDAYEYSLKVLYNIIVYSAVLLSLFFTLFAPIIISFLYGTEYIPAIPVLRILSWYMAFSYYGAAKDVWILAEKKQSFLVLLNGSGAVCNVLLNMLLIPLLGIEGAALASLVTQCFTNVIMLSFVKELRYNNHLFVESLRPHYLLQSIKHVKNSLSL